MRLIHPAAGFAKSPQKPCQGEGGAGSPCPPPPASGGRCFWHPARRDSAPCPRAGFTLPELLAVMAVIGILASMISGAVVVAQRQARQTGCKSNLRQFGVSLQLYRGEHQKNPPWLSSLFPDYVDSKGLYVCRSDIEKGKGPVRPDSPNDNNYNNVPDNISNPGRPFQNTDPLKRVERCSYFYEFSWARLNPANWYSDLPIKLRFTDETEVNYVSWCDYKECQMRFGDYQSGATADNPRPYSETDLPIIRCFHHWQESRVNARQPDTFNYYTTFTGTPIRDPITLNVAYAGNVYVGPLKWECKIQPGDNAQ